MLTRRHFLTASAATLAAPLAPRRLWAASTLTLGETRIDTLSDGNLVLPVDFILGGMPEAELQDIRARYGLPSDQLTPPCNVTLLRDGTNTVLFDVGSGPDFQPSAGKLTEALAAMDLTVEDVTHVLFTHGHPDHLWGLLDDFDEPLFPNAQHMIGQAEFDYWTDPETANTIGEARATFAAGASRRLGVIADSLRLLIDGEEPLPGIFARLTPGHTPGHLAYEIAGPTPAMVLGDCIGNHHVAFERPDWASNSDQDKALAATTRTALLDRLAVDGHAIIGFHLPGGGIGRVERADKGYRFVEET
ncbi:MBL fold metallo-hydrolase [Rhodobacteraceae bacterium HSP-20]|uniref:MBL fold metallo-hydrolase n=1 Tax=Paragemmobacter amnigenus TaxID=2852097 RepID=A0ABS6J518_9RHOB|nr:MBL fold metallo-hydrolase [Rhodobacter amnigenus]MBU9698855.1 MBL fold metallo-hydrolase [Rhodobacter amnigenus]MBV4390082.1 MBL fold metallo-hydrolase [Rhodobacter amnigenus]